MIVKVNIIVRKIRSNKKNTTCDHCERTLANPNKFSPEVLPISPVLSNNEENRYDQREKQVLIPIFGRDYITNKEAKSCQTFFYDLEQYNKDAVRPPTKEKLDKYKKMSKPEAGPKPKTQFFRKDNKTKNLINEKFSHLGEITDEQKRELKFREQEELGIALKRRAIAVHCAKVPRSYSNNRNLLEKEFDKHGQFKFALCSLDKFLIDDKPGNENKKSSRIYNWAEIDDYLSNAFEQIIYLVEERGGKSNV
ncbi:30060_t:CDS:2 [Gigaspora margarita]|uniref:30060_t:CDS:1 n=1 Tax=Gigaspora margarita TaxID=4874 RepID=A0ABN7UN57_GIGMA|nr:30060_t:CDS:2 [Gigaspora margarita]